MGILRRVGRAEATPTILQNAGGARSRLDRPARCRFSGVMGTMYGSKPFLEQNETHSGGVDDIPDLPMVPGDRAGCVLQPRKRSPRPCPPNIPTSC